MAGGNWEKQNKELSGAYTNFETNDLVVQGLDSKGAVVIPIMLDWGVTGVFSKVTPNTKFKELFGKDLKDLKPIREAFKGTGNVIVYNLNGKGDEATATSGTFVVKAVHGGSDGNKIVVTVAHGLNGDATVRTFFDGERVDSQIVSSTTELIANPYVVFNGELPAGDATLTLSKGATVSATNDSYATFATALDTQIFKTIAIGTDDDSIKLLLSLKVKQWREEEGKNVTIITNDYNAADHEGTVSIKNGVYIGGELISAKDAVYWYGAAYANASTNSLTYTEYPGATDVERLSSHDVIKAKRDGHVVFIYDEGADGLDRVVVESDINTFRSFTPKKNQDFCKGTIVRQMDIMGNNVKHIYSRYFIGKVKNHADGRNLFKGAIMKDVLDILVKQEAIEPYNPNDITIEQGDLKDAVLVLAGVKFVDAMEKLYMTILCK
ncbi:MULTISPECIES: phage tail sheath C-terminal domain-containing protein [unclassified Lysinibacillus]|uniref:phage tail sheath C-terminal domain-containing protein n=1 Tax=unclassified Lysinibacillus TaxID=2636778 RepID=UPI0038100B1E